MWLNLLMAFVIACVATAILTPFTIRLAYKVGAVDVPKDERRAHAKPMPRIGGLAFIAGFFISTLIIFLCCEIDRTVNLIDVNLVGELRRLFKAMQKESSDYTIRTGKKVF